MQLPNNEQPLLLPGVSPKMLCPAFWTVRFPDFNLDADWIGNFKYQPELSLRDYLANSDSLLKNLYTEDGTPPACEKIFSQINVWDGFEYGLMVESGDLKLLPQETSLFSNKGEPDLDRNQLSGLDPGDQLTIFGISADGNWLGVISDAGVGWIERKLVGIGPRKEIENYLNEPDRLTTIDPCPKILLNNRTIDASMGCNFPLNDHLRHTVIIPGRNPKGELSYKTGAIIGETVRDHLPKSAHYLIRQAFKYLGHRYAWGDRNAEGKGRDCSRLIRDVLRSLGFKPPRNSREQLAASKNRINMSGMNLSQRLVGLRKLSPGSLLFTSGHVMFFLGEYQGEVYAIHALNNYRRIADNIEEPVKVKQVVVSGLTLGSGTGAGSLLEQITEVVEV
ncbi:MAG: NlpC/P60 family protein [Bacteroidota bacterium]